MRNKNKKPNNDNGLAHQVYLMGNSSTIKQRIDSEKYKNMVEKVRKHKVLCLHGWRTSGKIMSMQTAAFRYNCGIDCSFMDAPYTANGDPDAGIAMIYTDEPYFEWYYKDSASLNLELDNSISSIIQYMEDHGPFDGLLGFSQGGAMATRLASLQTNGDKRLNNVPLLKFIVLIGGVVPIEPYDKVRTLHCADWNV